jgi:hypothetical protein
VARVQVNLQAQGKPVASAIVQLTDADGKTHTRVLEPSAEGILIFERVPLGKVSITARYGDEGQSHRRRPPSKPSGRRACRLSNSR